MIVIDDNCKDKIKKNKSIYVHNKLNVLIIDNSENNRSYKGYGSYDPSNKKINSLKVVWFYIVNQLKFEKKNI